MTKREAVEFVEEFKSLPEDVEIDEVDIEEAFTVIFERTPDAEDRATGLWSLLCG